VCVCVYRSASHVCAPSDEKMSSIKREIQVLRQQLVKEEQVKANKQHYESFAATVNSVQSTREAQLMLDSSEKELRETLASLERLRAERDSRAVQLAMLTRSLLDLRAAYWEERVEETQGGSSRPPFFSDGLAEQRRREGEVAEDVEADESLATAAAAERRDDGEDDGGDLGASEREDGQAEEGEVREDGEVREEDELEGGGRIQADE
jgi:hypothetical protein